MKRWLLLLILLVAFPATAADLTIKDGSTATVTLSDGSTINMRFSVASDGTISWFGAMGRDNWFAPAVNGGAPSPKPPVPPVPNGPVISTITLPAAVVGNLYAAPLSASGGSTPYSWTVATGSLPDGLAILPPGGIVGIPTTAGTFSIRLTCTDANGLTASADLSIIVTGTTPPDPPTPVVQTIQVVIVEETGDSTSAMSKLRNSKEIRDYCEKGGHKIFFIDKDYVYTGEGVDPYKRWVAGAGPALPYGFITPVGGGDPGTALDKRMIPTDVAGFLAWIQKYGGPPVAGSARIDGGIFTKKGGRS